MTQIPAVIVSDAFYNKCFWNTNTLSFARPIMDKWILFFQKGREKEAKEYARRYNGQFIHTDDSLIKPPKIPIEIPEKALIVLRDIMIYGVMYGEKSGDINGL